MKKLEFKKALPLVTVILVVVAGILLGVEQALKSIDISQVPEVWRGLLIYIINIFSGATFAAGLVWLRNIFGFLTAKARKASEGTTVEYDINRFYKTLAGYMGSISIVFVAAPTPELKAIGSLVVFFIDLIPSVLGDIFQKPALTQT